MLKVLFATSECYPFAASGGLGDVAGSLPAELVKQGVDCRVILPLYGTVKPEYREKMKFLGDFTVRLGWRNQYCGIFETERGGVKYYFIDNEYYFKRDGMYGYFDDGERFAYFAKAILEFVINCDFKPELIHLNDWQTAMAAVYLNTDYRMDRDLSHVKTLFTIHNIQYQGKYSLDISGDLLGLSGADKGLVEYDRCVNYMKGAIECADRVNTVSPSYAREILDPWFSHGLDRELRDKQFKLSGILNGINTAVYNPEGDEFTVKSYSAADLSGKAECKKALCAEFDLEADERPVIGMVTRLVAHKGLDLVKYMAEYIVGSGMRVVMLGSGEDGYERFFSDFADSHHGSFALRLGYDNALAHRIYAGADMFLMPSKSEPCGLAQMIALRYGTIPIVRETGGLADSVSDCGNGVGNGFTFKTYNAHDMWDACIRARDAYRDAELWEKLVKRALESDFGWQRAAASYKSLYGEIDAAW